MDVQLSLEEQRDRNTGAYFNRKLNLQMGLKTALVSVFDTYIDLNVVAGWLANISNILDPENKPSRTGDEVCDELFEYLDQLVTQTNEDAVLADFACGIYKTTCNYESGLFHTYNILLLPRTNNDRESEFRGLNRRLLITTGQKGATIRLIQRSGAWEVIPRPDSLEKTIEAIAQVDRDEFLEERDRVYKHRARFKLHTRSANQASKKLLKLKEEWLELPNGSGP